MSVLPHGALTAAAAYVSALLVKGLMTSTCNLLLLLIYIHLLFQVDVSATDVENSKFFLLFVAFYLYSILKHL